MKRIGRMIRNVGIATFAFGGLAGLTVISLMGMKVIELDYPPAFLWGTLAIGVWLTCIGEALLWLGCRKRGGG